eukprot:TRINITY_DN190_c0_g1_i1.p1 TRINITY_DN190_c0_g1~~TRINITY_DN190_c0_g1_i1.p1  ORF type:complete len:760 (-),score=284.50 TRINITY_DN190_c0_g1_i1:19-2298(-)
MSHIVIVNREERERKEMKGRNQKIRAPSEASVRLTDVLPRKEERMDDVLELPADLVEKFMKLRSPPSPGRPGSSTASPPSHQRKIEETDGDKMKEDEGEDEDDNVEESMLSEMDTSFVPEIHVEESADASRILQQSMMVQDGCLEEEDDDDDGGGSDGSDGSGNESMEKSLDSTFEESVEGKRAKVGNEEQDARPGGLDDDQDVQNEEDHSFIEPSSIIQSDQREPETPDAEYSSFKSLVEVLLEKTGCTDLKELQEAVDEERVEILVHEKRQEELPMYESLALLGGSLQAWSNLVPCFESAKEVVASRQTVFRTWENDVDDIIRCQKDMESVDGSMKEHLTRVDEHISEIEKLNEGIRGCIKRGDIRGLTSLVVRRAGCQKKALEELKSIQQEFDDHKDISETCRTVSSRWKEWSARFEETKDGDGDYEKDVEDGEGDHKDGKEEGNDSKLSLSNVRLVMKKFEDQFLLDADAYYKCESLSTSLVLRMANLSEKISEHIEIFLPESERGNIREESGHDESKCDVDGADRGNGVLREYDEEEEEEEKREKETKKESTVVAEEGKRSHMEQSVFELHDLVLSLHSTLSAHAKEHEKKCDSFDEWKNKVDEMVDSLTTERREKEKRAQVLLDRLETLEEKELNEYDRALEAHSALQKLQLQYKYGRVSHKDVEAAAQELKSATNFVNDTRSAKCSILREVLLLARSDFPEALSNPLVVLGIVDMKAELGVEEDEFVKEMVLENELLQDICRNIRSDEIEGE